MLEFELNIIINRPIEEVFTVLSDLENDLKWRREWVDAQKTTEGPIGVGTRFSLFAKSFGRRMETVYETTSYQLNQIVAWKTIVGPLPLSFERIFERAEGGTRFKIRYLADVHGFLRLLLLLSAGLVKRQHRSDLQRVKELMDISAL
ncbi:MAG: SRPBCC family protein [Lewinellaceae bacterium]|nr:SRPBCC family protein [Lewinellaceae bacterium]